MSKRKIRLGVNLDHVTTLRQVRGGTTSYPDLMKHVKLAVAGGADQITIHLREDRRHIQLTDLALLSKKCPVDLNLEMASTQEMLRFAKKYRPNIACLVPEKRQELTTEGGLDVAKSVKRLKKYIGDLEKAGIPTSMFIDPSLKQVRASHQVGAVAVELHTGTYVRLKGAARIREWNRLVSAAKLAHKLGLAVHAGHGLDYQTAKDMKRLPHLVELNIGHFLVCEALEVGMKKSVLEMVRTLRVK